MVGYVFNKLIHQMKVTIGIAVVSPRLACFTKDGQEVMFCDTGRVRRRPVNMATLLLVSVLVAHLLHFESEINKGKKRHSRNATVIWHGGGSLALPVVRNSMLAAKTAGAACQKVGRIARAVPPRILEVQLSYCSLCFLFRKRLYLLYEKIF